MSDNESAALAKVPQQGVAREDVLASASFADIVNMGNALIKTGFLPEHVKTGAQAAAIILTGRELGMPPMRALRSLAMVKGKVTEYADSQLARFKSDGGHAKFVKLDDVIATLWLRHPNGDEHTETFALEDAKRAGLLSGGSGMYSKYTRAMLRSRAITAGLKSIGWEGGAGAYDPAELVPAADLRDTNDGSEGPIAGTDNSRPAEARVEPGASPEAEPAVPTEADMLHAIETSTTAAELASVKAAAVRHKDALGADALMRLSLPFKAREKALAGVAS